MWIHLSNAEFLSGRISQMAQLQRPYTFIEVEFADGKQIIKVLSDETRMMTLLDPSIPNVNETIKILEDSMDYKERFDTKENKHQNWEHEHFKARFSMDQENAADTPDDMLSNCRYSPEFLLFSEDRTIVYKLADKTRIIVAKKAIANLKELFIPISEKISRF